MPAITGTIVDLSTVFGRVVALLRQDLRHSQSSFARLLQVDRSLLARVESGRNTASIDNVFLIEETFIKEHRIRHHGDLVLLCARVARELADRGGRIFYGNLPRPETDEDLDTGILDRIVAVVVDKWLGEMAGGEGVL